MAESPTTVLPDCETRLLEAQLAYHKLQTGQETVQSVGYEGRQVTYRVADLDQLRLYIRELEQECGCAGKVRQPFTTGLQWD